MRLRVFSTAAIAAALMLFGSAPSRDPGAAPDRRRGELTWLADWQSACAAAARTRRPILLVFGVPAYESVPGVW